MLEVACSCGHSLRLADELSGKLVKCPRCASAIRVPVVSRRRRPDDNLVEPPQRAERRGRRRDTRPSTKPTPQVRNPEGKRQRRHQAFAEEGAGESWATGMGAESGVPWSRGEPVASARPPEAGRASGKWGGKSGKSLGAQLRLGALVGCSLVGLGLFSTVATILVASGTFSGPNSNEWRDPASVDFSAETPGSGSSSATAAEAGAIFPDRPVPQSTEAGGIRVSRVSPPGSQRPGVPNSLIIYEPSGKHADRSLGCVLIAPAGTMLIHGISVATEDAPEALPYAQAGFLVVHYSLDGDPGMQLGGDREAARCYSEFRSASAGVLNVKYAAEFVRSRYPEVDSGRIYAAGHSSAGTLALLAAQYLPEHISGCLAYAPCSDVEAYFEEIEVYDFPVLFPRAREFSRLYSPMNHVGQLRCPLFLFQARDDSVVRPVETRRFYEAVRRQNSSVRYVEAASGGHYESMIHEGIPQGIRWLQEWDGRRR